MQIKSNIKKVIMSATIAAATVGMASSAVANPSCLSVCVHQAQINCASLTVGSSEYNDCMTFFVTECSRLRCTSASIGNP